MNATACRERPRREGLERHAQGRPSARSNDGPVVDRTMRKCRSASGTERPGPTQNRQPNSQRAERDERRREQRRGDAHEAAFRLQQRLHDAAPSRSAATTSRKRRFGEPGRQFAAIGRRSSALSRKPSPRGCGSSIVMVAEDAAGIGRHHDDPGRQEHGLVDRVRDEHRGQLALPPKAAQIGVELVAGEFVERAERLVHQQQIGARSRARARSRPASSCRRRAAAENAARSRRQPDHARSPRPRTGAALACGTSASSSGSRTLASTRAHGISVGSWNTKANRLPSRPTCVEVAAPPQQPAIGRLR